MDCQNNWLQRLSFLTEVDFAIFLSGVIVLLIIGNLAGKLSIYCKQPVIVGQVLVGGLLGQSCLGHLFPSFIATLYPNSGGIALADYVLTQLSAVIILFLIGLDLSLKTVRKNLYNLCIIDAFTIIIPFLTGLMIVHVFPHLFGIDLLTSHNQSILTIFMGILLFVPALAVISRLLVEQQLVHSQFGNLLLSSAGLSEILAWVTFAVLASIVDNNHIIDDTTLLILLSILYLILVLSVGKKPIAKMLSFCEAKKINSTACYLILCLISCVVVSFCGLHVVIGAFVMGAAINNSIEISPRYRQEIESIVSQIFFPIYFLLIGLKTDFIGDFNSKLFIVVLLACFLSKYFAIKVANLFLKKLDESELNIIKWCAITRGATEILLAKMALNLNIISTQLFVVIVIVALIMGSLGSYMFKRNVPLLKNVREI